MSPDLPTWRERFIGIRLTNTVGIERTLSVRSTDLSIPNRRRALDRLEDGLLPVSLEVRDQLLKLAQRAAPFELYLMLALGFFSGMRLGTICDLKVETLDNAIPDPVQPSLLYLTIGPGANPRVATKFGVTGRVLLPRILLDELRIYASSARRAHRMACATKAHQNLLFLNRFGKPYTRGGVDGSNSINVEMSRLRERGVAEGVPIGNFHFHQSRATFGTAVAEIAVQSAGPINAIALVRELLLHKDEATTLKYIRFVERTPLKATIANEFTRAFFGRLNPNMQQDARERHQHP